MASEKERMKKYCKSIDILDIRFLDLCAADCLRKKWKRRDVEEYFAEMLHASRKAIRQKIQNGNKPELAHAAALRMQRELKAKKLRLAPIWYKDKVDSSNNKTRRIGIQHISQQLYDYVAVYAMSDLMRRIGEHQYASIPGRGPQKGMLKVRKWLKEKDVKYIAQLDVKKCFPSIPIPRVLAMVDKYVANADARWLVHELLSTFDGGLSIGSYLSQYLCNLYMSQLYHEIKERMYYERRGKRIPLSKHALFYMDDILLLGTSSKGMHKAVKLICKYAEDKMGLVIKASWTVRRVDDGQFVDTMGFRVYGDHTTIRRRVFLRVRRAYRAPLKSGKITQKMARKCVSYYGHIKNTNSVKLARKYKIHRTFRKSKGVIACDSVLRRRAAQCPYRRTG